MKKLLIKTGTYQKDGETKNRYTDLGVIMENENGEFALIDPSVNLAGCLIQQNAMNPQKQSTRLMVSVFTQDGSQRPQGLQQGQSRTAPAPSQQRGQDVFDDDIPF